MMKKILFITISLLVSNTIFAQKVDTLFVKANNLFAQNKFEEAGSIYESILENGYESWELYFNLGNTYYKQNLIAKAIVNYERALLLNPSDPDIKYNLELTNRLVVDKIEVLPVFFLKSWLNGLRNIFSSDNWAIISIISFIVSLVFISLYLYSRNIGFKKISFWLGFFFLFLTLVSVVFAYQQKKKITSKNTAIVISPTVTVKSSPDDSGTDLFVLHEGTKLWIEDKISDWNEIKLSDGSKGWIKTEDFEVI